MPRLATAQHNQHPNHCERYHYSDGNDGHHVFATTYDRDWDERERDADAMTDVTWGLGRHLDAAPPYQRVLPHGMTAET